LGNVHRKLGKQRRAEGRLEHGAEVLKENVDALVLFCSVS
jgi:hypothetical protein